jgi:hypothetical protein
VPPDDVDNSRSRKAAPKKSVGPQMDYTRLTIAEIANGISKTEAAIRRCREILDDLQEPKTVGQAVVKAIRDLLPKLEEESLHPRHRARVEQGGDCSTT